MNVEMFNSQKHDTCVLRKLNRFWKIRKNQMTTKHKSTQKYVIILKILIHNIHCYSQLLDSLRATACVRPATHTRTKKRTHAHFFHAH
jgi:hypothetical protein